MRSVRTCVCCSAPLHYPFLPLVLCSQFSTDLRLRSNGLERNEERRKGGRELHDDVLRGHPNMTSTTFLDFWTPPCNVTTYRIRSTLFLLTAFWGAPSPPPTADVICVGSLSAAVVANGNQKIDFSRLPSLSLSLRLFPHLRSLHFPEAAMYYD